MKLFHCLVGLIVLLPSVAYLQQTTTPQPITRLFVKKTSLDSTTQSAAPPTTSSKTPWSPETWKSFPPTQMPVYDDLDQLKKSTDRIRNYAPLVFAGEVRSLHDQLAKATQGRGFLLMGGDCAESFEDFNVDSVRDTFR